MTTDAFRQRVALWKDMLFLGGAISGFATLFLSVIFAGVFALWGPSIRGVAQDWLGITDISGQISALSGANRVTQQPDGMSYVREPVTIGRPITLVIHIGRTEVGAGCILEEVIPLFADDFGSTFAGEPRNPAQQLGPQVVRRELVLNLPPSVKAGHVTLTLQLEYDCGGVTIFETTKPVSFYADAALP